MDHKDLDVWKKSMLLVEKVYSISSNFPIEERFGLSSQIRRASVSIPSNISEGAARKGKKENFHFINIALGSLAEVETQYLIATRLTYIEKSAELEKLIVEVRKLLLGTRNFLSK